MNEHSVPASGAHDSEPELHSQAGRPEGVFELNHETSQPYRLYLHHGLTNGQKIKLMRRIVGNGGIVAQSEKESDVVICLKDDIFDVKLHLSSSQHLWRRSLHVEATTWVILCIHRGKCTYSVPQRKNMGGRPPGIIYTGFTPEDDDHLCRYIATQVPRKEEGGRAGKGIFQRLKRLCEASTSSDTFGFVDDYSWVARHPWQSWQTRYKKNQEEMDPIINEYAKELNPREDMIYEFRRRPCVSQARESPRSPHDYEKEEEEEEEEEGEEDIQQDACKGVRSTFKKGPNITPSPPSSTQVNSRPISVPPTRTPSLIFEPCTSQWTPEIECCFEAPEIQQIAHVHHPMVDARSPILSPGLQEMEQRADSPSVPEIPLALPSRDLNSSEFVGLSLPVSQTVTVLPIENRVNKNFTKGSSLIRRPQPIQRMDANAPSSSKQPLSLTDFHASSTPAPTVSKNSSASIFKKPSLPYEDENSSDGAADLLPGRRTQKRRIKPMPPTPERIASSSRTSEERAESQAVLGILAKQEAEALPPNLESGGQGNAYYSEPISTQNIDRPTAIPLSLDLSEASGPLNWNSAEDVSAIEVLRDLEVMDSDDAQTHLSILEALMKSRQATQLPPSHSLVNTEENSSRSDPDLDHFKPATVSFDINNDEGDEYDEEEGALLLEELAHAPSFSSSYLSPAPLPIRPMGHRLLQESSSPPRFVLTTSSNRRPTCTAPPPISPPQPSPPSADRHRKRTPMLDLSMPSISISQKASKHRGKRKLSSFIVNNDDGDGDDEELFPSPGTRAREMRDKLKEEAKRRTFRPYEGTRAAAALASQHWREDQF